MNEPQIADYRVFVGSYRWSGSWGAYQDYNCVVVAENESQAWTRAVTEYPDTKPDCWTFEEVDTKRAGTTYVSSACS